MARYRSEGGLIGERGFAFANIFCNLDPEIATAPGRLARPSNIVSEVADLDRGRLLKWIVVYVISRLDD